MPEPSKRAFERYVAKHGSANQAKVQLYQALMEEIKIRLRTIDSCTLGLLYNVPPPAVQEFGFLQLRMCCELVALACLTAHGEITNQTKLVGDYQADKILNGLEKLHPDFFPVPCKISIGKNNILIVEPIKGNLEKSGIAALYVECGSNLHKGSLKNLLREQMPRQVHYPQITKRAQHLIDLLSIHTIRSSDGQKVFLCNLFPSNGAPAEVAIAEAAPPGSEPPQ